eukprot:3836796-Karenia_brevis.AAC.1
MLDRTSSTFPVSSAACGNLSQSHPTCSQLWSTSCQAASQINRAGAEAHDNAVEPLAYDEREHML